MESIEITAKSLEEARKLAADKLGVSPDAVEATVLEEIKGLFGKSTVRVRATAATAAAPAEKPARAAKAEKAAKAEEPEKPEKPEKPAKPARAAAPKKADKPEAKAVVQAPAEKAAESHEEAEDVVVATQEQADRITALLNELLESAGLAATARTSELNGKYVSIQIDGKDTSHLVGKHGEVLNQLQYLTNVMCAQQFQDGVRATIDGNDYRHKREEQLTRLASQIAEQVKVRGEEAVLDALPAFERRIIHKALGEIEGITTYSEGVEPNRRVVIAPAEAS